MGPKGPEPLWGTRAVDAYKDASAYPKEPCNPFVVEAAALGHLVAEKNAAYGDSFTRSGEIMQILYPKGISPDQMTDALGVVRVIDKLFRIANRKDAFGENPWGDIAGYGLVATVRGQQPK